MDCTEFIHGFSEFVDGEGDALDMGAAEAHLATCLACRRYLKVVDRGRELLRSMPRIEVSDDFHPRLRHRLYHVEDERLLSRASATSSATAATVVGMAVIITAVAWAPLLQAPEPELELTPIVVSRPAVDGSPWARPVVSFGYGDMDPLRGQLNLWEGSHLLLYEYSPLSERYRRATPITRVGQD